MALTRALFPFLTVSGTYPLSARLSAKKRGLVYTTYHNRAHMADTIPNVPFPSYSNCLALTWPCVSSCSCLLPQARVFRGALYSPDSLHSLARKGHSRKASHWSCTRFIITNLSRPSTHLAPALPSFFFAARCMCVYVDTQLRRRPPSIHMLNLTLSPNKRQSSASEEAHLQVLPPTL